MDMQRNNLVSEKISSKTTARTGGGGKAKMMDDCFVVMRKPLSITNSRYASLSTGHFVSSDKEQSGPI
jgi:hypothetical protein